MYDPTLRRDFSATLREVCDAMRAQKRAVDLANSQFKACSRESQKALEKSYRTLDRLSRGDDHRWH